MCCFRLYSELCEVVCFAVLMDPKKIFIWNVHDLISVARQDSVRTMLEASRSDIVCIQETKITTISRRVLLSALGSDFSDFIALPAVGASGGILVAWRRHIGITGNRRVDAHSVYSVLSREWSFVVAHLCLRTSRHRRENSVFAGAAGCPKRLFWSLAPGWGLQFDL